MNPVPECDPRALKKTFLVWHKKLKREIKGCNRQLDLLVRSAKRVTRKQSEVLDEVAGELKLEIPLKSYASDTICKAYKPHDWIPKEDGICENEDGCRVVKGVKTEGILTFKIEDKEEENKSSRYFKMKVRYVYPQWKQVFV